VAAYAAHNAEALRRQNEVERRTWHGKHGNIVVEWRERDEDAWSGYGMVACPDFEGSLVIRGSAQCHYIFHEPHEGCPFATEHMVSRGKNGYYRSKAWETPRVVSEFEMLCRTLLPFVE